MKAFVCDGYGPPGEVLHLADTDEPVAVGDQVLVQVHAASVNPADWHLIRGTPYIARLQMGLSKPSFRVPGCDVAGVVEAVGPNVTTLRPGDDVFGSPFMRGFGAFAERAAVAEGLLERKPANLSFEQAAAVPLAASTALQGLRDHARLEHGQRVLVIGASGGVGTFAVQIARALGAEVTGVCSTRNVDLVRSLGADHVVDYTADDVLGSGQRYDVVLQAAGTTSPSDYQRVLTPAGTLVQVSGDSDGRWIGPVARMVTARLLSAFVSQRLAGFTVRPNKDDLRTLRQLIEAGKVMPVIDRTYPLRELPHALRHLEAGHARGKTVVTL